MAKRTALGKNPALSLEWISNTTKKQEGTLSKTKQNPKEKHIDKSTSLHKHTITDLHKPVKTATPLISTSKKARVSLWVDEKIWEKLKENSIKLNKTVIDYATEVLYNKVDKHITINTDKHFNSSKEGKVQLSLKLPLDLLVKIKLQSLKLRVPYSLLIIEIFKKI